MIGGTGGGRLGGGKVWCKPRENSARRAPQPRMQETDRWEAPRAAPADGAAKDSLVCAGAAVIACSRCAFGQADARRSLLSEDEWREALSSLSAFP